MKRYEGYKDSGIEWIGHIPKSWSVQPVFKTGYESRIKNKDEQEKNLLSLSYGRIIRKNIETSFGLLPESFSTYQIPCMTLIPSWITQKTV
jgi:type I restriction enzyme, S subunit